MANKKRKKKTTYQKSLKKALKSANPVKKIIAAAAIVLLAFFGTTNLNGVDFLYENIYEVMNQAESPLEIVESILSGSSAESVSLSEIPAYSGEAYVVINENVPFFTDKEITDQSYESYSALDMYGRCGVTIACIGQDIMPTEERGAIGMIKPSGWHTVKYDIVDGKYLYNRCHLIGYQLSGENANEKNLITGTRYLNVVGMLPFENEVADYVEETGNHVMYRVTPIFEGNNLVASGVEMEALSVEDNGQGVCFHVYVYNVQPGITIDYATGESWLTEETD